MLFRSNFVKPKSESADAKRKQEQKAAEVAKLAEFSDAELRERRQDLLTNGDNKSVREALKLGKELDRRNSTEVEAEKAQRKMMVEKIVTRVKELAKAGTQDADTLLLNVLAMLG